MACLREYEILVKNPLGEPRFLVMDEYSVQWALKLNAAGTLTMDLPSAFCTSGVRGYTLSDIGEDYRIEIWRTANGLRKLVGDSPFFVNKISSKLANDGKRVVHVEGQNGNNLLDRRTNPYNSGDNNQKYDGAQSVTMSAFFCQVFERNFGAQARYYGGAVDNRRRLDGDIDGTNIAIFDTSKPYLICNAVPFNGATTINSDFSTTGNQSPLSLYKKATEYSFSQGQALFFNVVQVSNYASIYPHFELRVYTGQQGVDRTQAAGGANAVIISDTNFTIAEYEFTYDWSKAARGFATTGKNNSGQAVRFSSDIPLILDTNPFALREKSASSSQTGTALGAEADRNLQSNKPVSQLSGSLVTDETFIYGFHYDYGDKLTAVVEGIANTVFIDEETCKLENGKEDLRVGFSTDLVRALTGAGELVQAVVETQKQVADLQAVIAS